MTTDNSTSPPDNRGRAASPIEAQLSPAITDALAQTRAHLDDARRRAATRIVAASLAGDPLDDETLVTTERIAFANEPWAAIPEWDAPDFDTLARTAERSDEFATQFEQLVLDNLAALSLLIDERLPTSLDAYNRPIAFRIASGDISTDEVESILSSAAGQIAQENLDHFSRLLRESFFAINLAHAATTGRYYLLKYPLAGPGFTDIGPGPIGGANVANAWNAAQRDVLDHNDQVRSADAVFDLLHRLGLPGETPQPLHGQAINGEALNPVPLSSLLDTLDLVDVADRAKAVLSWYGAGPLDTGEAARKINSDALTHFLLRAMGISDTQLTTIIDTARVLILDDSPETAAGYDDRVADALTDLLPEDRFAAWLCQRIPDPELARQMRGALRGHVSPRRTLDLRQALTGTVLSTAELHLVAGFEAGFERRTRLLAGITRDATSVGQTWTDQQQLALAEVHALGHKIADATLTMSKTDAARARELAETLLNVERPIDNFIGRFPTPDPDAPTLASAITGRAVLEAAGDQLDTVHAPGWHAAHKATLAQVETLVNDDRRGVNDSTDEPRFTSNLAATLLAADVVDGEAFRRSGLLVALAPAFIALGGPMTAPARRALEAQSKAAGPYALTQHRALVHRLVAARSDAVRLEGECRRLTGVMVETIRAARDTAQLNAPTLPDGIRSSLRTEAEHGKSLAKRERFFNDRVANVPTDRRGDPDGPAHVRSVLNGVSKEGMDVKRSRDTYAATTGILTETIRDHPDARAILADLLGQGVQGPLVTESLRTALLANGFVAEDGRWHAPPDDGRPALPPTGPITHTGPGSGTAPSTSAPSVPSPRGTGAGVEPVRDQTGSAEGAKGRPSGRARRRRGSQPAQRSVAMPRVGTAAARQTRPAVPQTRPGGTTSATSASPVVGSATTGDQPQPQQRGAVAPSTRTAVGERPTDGSVGRLAEQTARDSRPTVGRPATTSTRTTGRPASSGVVGGRPAPRIVGGPAAPGA